MQGDAMNEPTCETCRFFLIDACDIDTAGPPPAVATGYCRRFPPQILHDEGYSDPLDHAGFPWVWSDTWCGEHQPRQTERNEQS